MSSLRATLGEVPFTVDDVDALARAPARLVLSDSARGAVAEAHAVVQRYAAGDEPVYGLNTGLGAKLGFRVEREEIDDFQEQLVRGRAIGVGEPLPEAVCRAALVVRCIGLSRGGAGVSPALLDLLLAMVERGVTPVIPRRGSIGAGDLGLAAHMAAVATGRGEAWQDGRRMPGDAALAAAGLAPARLVGRDGHALCNTSSVSTGHAALTLADAARLMVFSAHAAALACEGFGVNVSMFDAQIAALRPAARQEDAAALFRRLLDGSSLRDAPPRRVQDPLSFRCLAQVVGVALHALAEARREVEIELAGIADSPVVLSDGRMSSTANFHTPALAFAFDGLAIAHAQLAAGVLPASGAAARSRADGASALPVAGRRRLGRVRARAEAVRFARGRGAASRDAGQPRRDARLGRGRGRCAADASRDREARGAARAAADAERGRGARRRTGGGPARVERVSARRRSASTTPCAPWPNRWRSIESPRPISSASSPSLPTVELLGALASSLDGLDVPCVPRFSAVEGIG